MSGGAFNYEQYKLLQIADSIEQEILNNGRKKRKDELDSYQTEEYLSMYPEDAYHCSYSPGVIVVFKKAVLLLRLAYIFAHRIDWLLSGDGGEETFIERLTDEIKTSNIEGKWEEIITLLGSASDVSTEQGTTN